MKKLLAVMSALTLVFTLAVCFSVSADNEKESRVVINNVVYELKTTKYSGKDYGEHYVVKDFFEDESLAETTVKINIVDEINGVEVKGIDANKSDYDDRYMPIYKQQYSSVKEINMPNTIKYIGDYSFIYFPSVEQLYLSQELEYIGVGAFRNMEALKSMILPENCSVLKEQTFYNCKSLEKVVGEIEYIGNYAFMNCEKLTSINVSSNCTYIGECALYNVGIKKLVLPSTFKSIERPVGQCAALEKLVFEDKDNGVGEYVDCGTMENLVSLKALYIKTIPTKGISFCSDFLDSPNLKNIYFAGSEEKWDELVPEYMRLEIEKRNITVTFYYRHSHSYTKTSTATCVKSGKVTYKCECGDSYSYTVAKNTEGHKYGSWKVVTKSTYTVQGYKKRTCSLCGNTQKKNLPQPVLGTVSSSITSNKTATTIKFTWNAVNDATGYRVYMKKDGKYTKIDSIKGKTTYTVKNLDKGTKYYFAVRPYYKDSSGNVVFGSYTKFSITTAKS